MGKMCTVFSAGGVLHIALELKIYVNLSFADRLWSVITLTIGLKAIPDLLDTNSTHTHGYRIFLHHRTGVVDIWKQSWVEGGVRPAVPEQAVCPVGGED